MFLLSKFISYYCLHYIIPRILHIISRKRWYSMHINSWWWAVPKMCVFNFAILLKLRKSRKFDAREIYMFHSSFCVFSVSCCEFSCLERVVPEITRYVLRGSLKFSSSWPWKEWTLLNVINSKKYCHKSIGIGIDILETLLTRTEMTHHVSVEMINSLLIHHLVIVVVSSLPITGVEILLVILSVSWGGGLWFRKCEPVHLLHDSLEEANQRSATDGNIISKHNNNFTDRQCSAREYQYFEITGVHLKWQ